MTEHGVWRPLVKKRRNTNLFFVPLLARIDPLSPGTHIGVALGFCYEWTKQSKSYLTVNEQFSCKKVHVNTMTHI